MLTNALHEKCLWCEKPYSAKSRPLWTVDGELRIVGTLHAAHAPLWRRRHGLPVYHTLSRMVAPDEAHRTVWWRRRAARLGITPHLALTNLFRLPAQRRKLLRLWKQRNGGITAEQRLQILHDTELADAEYRAEYPNGYDIYGLE